MIYNIKLTEEHFSALNRRRAQLIQENTGGILTPFETLEFQALQEIAGQVRDFHTPAIHPELQKLMPTGDTLYVPGKSEKPRCESRMLNETHDGYVYCGYTSVRRVWCPTWTTADKGPMNFCEAHARMFMPSFNENAKDGVFHWGEDADMKFKEKYGAKR